MPVNELLERRAESAASRRAFLGTLGQAAVVAAGSSAMGGLAIAAPAAKNARIAIVGAGLAGLTCAWRLKQAGLTATVFEAATRLGGRCFSRRGYFADGQVVERGGELIDTGHTAVLDLAAEFGLPVDDLLAAEPAGTEPVYYFGGQSYTYAQVLTEFQAIYPALQDDVTAADYPTTFNSSTPRGRQLDKISIAQYIDQIVPGGHHSLLGQVLDVAYNIEFGAETEDQSALSLLYLLGFSEQSTFSVFGESDERFHIRGGNDQLVSNLASRLGNQIQTGTPLVAIAKNSDGRSTLTFSDGLSCKSQVFDHVVLALPFSILRYSVDISKANFSRRKRTAIAELGMGTNSKFQLQFKRRFWNALGNNGDSYADTGYQNTWEATRAQAGQAGVLVNFTGGEIGASYNEGTLAQRNSTVLSQLEPVLKGATRQFNGLSTLDYWPGYRWTRGSYAYWKVGQYTGFAGIESVRQGNVHFCGEHTSLDSQGYLNGAVDTGNNAAAEIIADLG
jgi:monoamine oxidase